ncbi:hypothetical protein [Streptomyces violens]|nr:hypothetical protein [Streptomyces violens]
MPSTKVFGTVRTAQAMGGDPVTALVHTYDMPSELAAEVVQER